MTSAPVTSNSMIPSPVPLVDVSAALAAVLVGLAPAFATQIDSWWVVLSVDVPSVSFE